MEIGLRRLELIRAALSVTRDLLTVTTNRIRSTDDNKLKESAKYILDHLASLGIEYSELAALHEDISCRIKTIKEMETL